MIRGEALNFLAKYGTRRPKYGMRRPKYGTRRLRRFAGVAVERSRFVGPVFNGRRSYSSRRA